MVRTQIQLTEAQSAQIKDAAAENHISMAEFIRQAVDSVLRQSPAIGYDTRRERAIQASGKFRSGGHDTSTRHDDRFTEAYRA